MAATEIYDYVSDAVPDSPTVTLSIAPQGIIWEIGDKLVEIHTADDRSEEAIIFSSDSVFFVTLQWNALSVSDIGTIFDIYHDANKACGIAKSFYWQHPTDGHYYVVKFRDTFQKLQANINIYGIASLKLKIIGRKPDA